MNRLHHLLSLLTAVSLTFSLNANAAILDLDNGQAGNSTTLTYDDDIKKLIGAKNVDVNGTLYDVSFTDGTFDVVFGSVPDFYADVRAAVPFVNALDNTVFVDVSTYLFDSNPALTRGCIANLCQVLFPTEDIGTAVRYIGFTNHQFDTGDGPRTDNLPRDFDGSANDFFTSAVFSQPSSVAAVPEPSTYAMLSAGLLMLAGFSRRSNRV